MGLSRCIPTAKTQQLIILLQIPGSPLLFFLFLLLSGLLLLLQRLTFKNSSAVFFQSTQMPPPLFRKNMFHYFSVPIITTITAMGLRSKALCLIRPLKRLENNQQIYLMIEWNQNWIITFCWGTVQCTLNTNIEDC